MKRNINKCIGNVHSFLIVLIVADRREEVQQVFISFSFAFKKRIYRIKTSPSWIENSIKLIYWNRIPFWLAILCEYMKMAANYLTYAPTRKRNHIRSTSDTMMVYAFEIKIPINFHWKSNKKNITTKNHKDRQVWCDENYWWARQSNYLSIY